MSFTKPMKRSKSLLHTFEPKPYQEAAIEFGISRPAAGFFLSPGLGKTIIILTIFKVLKKLGLVDELFVLANKRIMFSVWPKEVSKWKSTSSFKVKTVHGPKKSESLYVDADIRVMNYEGLPWLVTQRDFFKRGKRVMLACDESSKLRHSNTQRFKSLKKILGKFERRYIMTGSPAPNGLMGLFSQIYTLDLGESLGPFITAFRNEYFYPTGFMGHDWKLMPGADKRMFKKIKPLVIRYGNDQLNLPPITYVNRYVTLPKEARKAYDTMEREFVLQYKSGDIVAANAAVASGKLRQIANGGVLYSDFGEGASKDKPKFRTLHDEKCAELVELLEELNGEPALVAYEFKHDMYRIQKYLAAHAPQFKSAPFIGGHSKDKEVDGYIKKWENGKLPVMFGNPDSIAHGLNLQGKGGIVIFFSLTWNLENYEQFIQRVWRQGQTRRVIVYRIIARNTVDGIMRRALKSKDRTQKTLLSAMEDYYGIR